MAKQERIALDGFDAVQPTSCKFRFSTTMSQDSGRALNGTTHLNVLFTVESYEIVYEEVDKVNASKILKAIAATRKKPYFQLKRFSPYYGSWGTAEYYVGDGSLDVRTLEKNGEMMTDISFTAVGRNPI